MSEMVERVARAIAAVHIAEVKGTSSEEVVARRVEERWDSYVREACAAIEAMREPTPEMMEAGDAKGCSVAIWRAMIDAALNATEAPT